MNIPKTIVIIIFLSLLSFPIFISLNSTLAQTNLNQKNKAEALLTILENNNKTIRSTIDKLEAQNISVPETVKTTYIEGITHIQEAIELMNQEKYNEANNQSIEAMQKFKETLIQLDDALPIESTETEKIAEEAISLKANITRVCNVVQRLENLTAKATSAGYNTSEIENQLIKMKQHLENAKQKLNAINLKEAMEELNIVLRLLKGLEEYFIKLTNRISASNTENYLRDAEIRVAIAKIDITASTTLTWETKEEAITALNNSEANLAKARDSIENNNVDEAIKELEEAKKWEEESNRLITAVATTPTSIAPTNESVTESETMTSTSK